MRSSKQVGKDLEYVGKRQKKLQTQLEKQAKLALKQQFNKEAITELEKLEQEELALAAEYISKYKSFVLSAQLERRAELEQAYSSKRRGTLFTASQQDHVSFAQSLLEERTAALEGKRNTTTTAGSSTNASKTGGAPGGGHPGAAAGTGTEGASGNTIGHDLSTWELQRSEILLDNETLGTGSFGTVFKGRLRGKVVAVKVIPLSSRNAAKSKAILDDFRNECAVMSKLLHPNVLLWMGMCIDAGAGQLLMVTELMSGGSVFDQIHHKKKPPPSFPIRMKFAKDCAMGMNHLHLSRPPIMHLDLKTHNLLVDAHYVAKVADFGLAKVVGPEMRGTHGSPVYMAPEILNDEPYNEKADVYSFGIVLWELVTCRLPYEDQKLKGGTPGLVQLFRLVIGGLRPTMPGPDVCPPKFAELIQRCWDADPQKRPSFQQIIDSRIFDDVIMDKTFSEANILGRELWAQNFSNRDALEEAVDWDRFLQVLIKFCKITPEMGVTDISEDIRIKALHAVLVMNDNKVTLERFAHVLEWFGPLSKDDTFIETVYSTLRLRGFWGDVSSDQVTHLMAGVGVGAYAIRFSSQVGCFTITGKTAKGIENWRIQHTAGTPFILGDQQFPTLRKLMSTIKKELGLTRAVPGSKYSKLFAEHEEGLKSEYVDLTAKQ